MDIKVKKIGGSIIEYLFLKPEIVEKDDILVISAPGKVCSHGMKVTDYLINIFEKSKRHENYFREMRYIYDSFSRLMCGLNVEFDLDREFRIIETGLKSQTMSKDLLLSRGEYIASQIISRAFNKPFVDAKDVIKFRDGQIDRAKTDSLIKKMISKNVVVPGFYGEDEHGEIKTLSRGGSDVTGALIASGLNANYELIKGVEGVMLGLPDFARGPRRIEKISYDDMETYAQKGATIVHPDVIKILKDQHIPIDVKYYISRNYYGTRIGDESDPRMVKALGAKENMIEFMSKRTGNYDKFFPSIRSVLKKYDIDIKNILLNPTHARFFCDLERSMDMDDINEILNALKNETDIEFNFAPVSEISFIMSDKNEQKIIMKKIREMLGGMNVGVEGLTKEQNAIDLYVQSQHFHSYYNNFYQNLVDTSFNDTKKIE